MLMKSRITTSGAPTLAKSPNQGKQNYIKQFLGFLVPKFRRSEIPLHVFRKRLIPYYQMSISCFLEDIDPVLPNFDFMVSGRYWSHIQDFRNIKRIYICSVPVFPNNFKTSDFLNFEMFKHIFQKQIRFRSWIL